jgi:hypothetical protein
MQDEAVGPGGGSAETAHPAMALMEMICGYWVTQTLRTVAELSLADHIAAGAATAEEIARLEGSDPAATRRLLRAAASLGLFRDAGDGRFAVTGLGDLLRTQAPGSFREMAILQGSPLHWQSWSVLPDAVRSGHSQTRTALGLAKDENGFDYLATHPGEAALFAAAMASATAAVTDTVTATVDLDHVFVAVDVGGSTGALVQALMTHQPRLTGMVLELPHVIDSALHAAGKAGLTDRFTAVAGDFFQEVPAADLYLLKMILHDFSDTDCMTILRNCRASAKPGARALVIESVTGATGRPGTQPGFAALQDLNMLAVTGGQERSIEAFDALYAATGWHRVNLTPTGTPHLIQELTAI